MEKNNRKIMVVGFIVTAAMGFWVTKVILQTLAMAFGAIARYQSEIWFKDFIPVGVGAIIFFSLLYNEKVRIWADEALVEIKKVVWPSKKDTTAMTIVTCIMLIISGVVLGVFDVAAASFVKSLIN